jgi:hypothetical protein
MWVGVDGVPGRKDGKWGWGNPDAAGQVYPSVWILGCISEVIRLATQTYKRFIFQKSMHPIPTSIRMKRNSDHIPRNVQLCLLVLVTLLTTEVVCADFTLPHLPSKPHQSVSLCPRSSRLDLEFRFLIILSSATIVVDDVFVQKPNL